MATQKSTLESIKAEITSCTVDPTKMGIERTGYRYSCAHGSVMIHHGINQASRVTIGGARTLDQFADVIDNFENNN